MAYEKGKKVGGRGCPNCGGHDTEGTARAAEPGSAGVTWCNTCRHRWVPHAPKCRGYVISTKGEPSITGCSKCGVPDRVARMWPEAYRAMANKLDELKAMQLAVSNPSE